MSAAGTPVGEESSDHLSPGTSDVITIQSLNQPFRSYSKPVKPVVKRSKLCLKMKLIEGATWGLLKKKVSTTNLTKNVWNIHCVTISLHIFKTYYRYQKVKPDMSINSTKKVKIFLTWLLAHFLQYLKKYNPHIQKIL